MPKITLNFFGEKINTDIPKSLSALRSQIAKLFCFSNQDADEILLTYGLNGEKKTILNDHDLKTFLNSKCTTIDLDISQSSKIYKDNLNKLKEEKNEDEKILKELLKKSEELHKRKEQSFDLEKKEIKSIDAQIFELLAKKNEIQKKIFSEIQVINKELKENDKKIREYQKKLGVPEKETNQVKVEKMLLHFKGRHAPPKINIKKLNDNPHAQPCIPPKKRHEQPNKEQLLKSKPNFCPHVHPCFFERKYHIHPNKKKLEVKFAETEYIDIPKDEPSHEESNNEIDLKLRTIDDWGKCLLLKTKQVTNKIAEKFKDLENLNFNI